MTENNIVRFPPAKRVRRVFDLGVGFVGGPGKAVMMAVPKFDYSRVLVVDARPNRPSRGWRRHVR